MTDYSNLAVVLELLDDGLADDETLVRGGADVSDERRREVVAHVRESTEAQLTLFMLACELKADATDTEAALREELVVFADAVEEQFGVDILATAAAHSDRFPGLPDGLLAGA